MSMSTPKYNVTDKGNWSDHEVLTVFCDWDFEVEYYPVDKLAQGSMMVVIHTGKVYFLDGHKTWVDPCTGDEIYPYDPSAN